MTHTRLLLLAVAACGVAIASPAEAVTQSTTVKVNVVKPLSLTAIQGLDLGTLTLAGGTWTNITVGLSRTGVLSCGSANVICSGATQVARYNATGTNKEVLTISAPNVTLTNQSDSTKTLTMTIDAPPNVTR